jgi:hypothetical protein
MKLKIWKVKAEVRKPAKYRRKTTREFTPLKSGNPNLVENPRIVLASLHFFCRSRKHLPAAVSKQVCLHTSRPSGLGLALRWTSRQLPVHTQRSYLQQSETMGGYWTTSGAYPSPKHCFLYIILPIFYMPTVPYVFRCPATLLLPG